MLHTSSMKLHPFEIDQWDVRTTAPPIPPSASTKRPRENGLGTETPTRCSRQRMTLDSKLNDLEDEEQHGKLLYVVCPLACRTKSELADFVEEREKRKTSQSLVQHFVGPR